MVCDMRSHGYPCKAASEPKNQHYQITAADNFFSCILERHFHFDKIHTPVSGL